ncbi:hypothetical protein Vretimale_16086 [Volvox reticuliferus]|uniref:Uncharacterized protein n=1 Tax=Volvox reticuliferus TaxID=1737510 RepID=A0A8J4LX03_9CHLO|nr:hypothetical protein Vretimale_16086 [Volvox reticuliferus]
MSVAQLRNTNLDAESTKASVKRWGVKTVHLRLEGINRQRPLHTPGQPGSQRSCVVGRQSHQPHRAAAALNHLDQALHVLEVAVVYDCNGDVATDVHKHVLEIS